MVEPKSGPTSRRSSAPCSATARSRASAPHAPQPRSARGGSSDQPFPRGEEASRRTLAGRRCPSAGRPSRVRSSRSSSPRSGECRASPADQADGSPATGPGARDAATSSRAAAAAPGRARRAGERRGPAGGRGSRSASGACPRGSAGCDGATQQLPAALSARSSVESSYFVRWSSTPQQPPQWSCPRTRAAARRPG
jgi:hypothetical protein